MNVPPDRMSTIDKYKALLGIDAVELARRRAYFELGDEDLARLASLRPFAEKHTSVVVESFYELLLKHPMSQPFFRDDATVRRVKRTQREYFLRLFSGQCDLAYVEDRLRVGVAHERIGISPTLYLGAYRRYLDLIHRFLTEDIDDPRLVHDAFASIQKLVCFDIGLAMDTYLVANLEAIKRHQQAIRELSTPVILVHDRVLLLPLVGTLDGDRAQQVMETVLLEVANQKARVIIIDIAGVPLVDTGVADHLIKMTAAVRLLGAATILSGISAPAARTMVQLGVGLNVSSSMHTVARLSDGIELALRLLGERIVRSS